MLRCSGNLRVFYGSMAPAKGLARTWFDKAERTLCKLQVTFLKKMSVLPEVAYIAPYNSKHHGM